ncbi:hypothetical protein [Dyadobacter sp. 676]|uniref:Auto-transporter adhesin head GIN domain-containing protein n=1 Tax=Dyadobacter sp. 676 TaxID=3088362 RepID=A0AAU8FRB1_9BACT
MKISTILLTFTVTSFILFTLGSNIFLKTEFSKIDKTDPFYGFVSHGVKPFKYVRLKGAGLGLTQISNGSIPEIKLNIERKYLEWSVSHDTLTVTYLGDKIVTRPPVGKSFDSRPAIHISAPGIYGVSSNNIKCKIKDLKTDHLTIDQTGDGIALTDNSIGSLSAMLKSGALVLVDSHNQIGDSNIQVRDSSSFTSSRDVFGSFHAEVDSTAHLSVPGSLLKKMNK